METVGMSLSCDGDVVQGRRGGSIPRYQPREGTAGRNTDHIDDQDEVPEVGNIPGGSGNVAHARNAERSPSPIRPPGGQHTTISHRKGQAANMWKKIFQPPGGPSQLATDKERPHRRLGVADLGKHADEEKMPNWLASMLREEKYVKTEGVLPVLQQILHQNKSTQYAYFCHPCVQHISKLHREGGFCGYRNIQMLSSYIISLGTPGAQQLRGDIPSVFQIQDFIEAAWDAGINARGRIETGGIRGTRKYIGTPEVQAMLMSLQISCEAQGISNPSHLEAETMLLDAVEAYFQGSEHDSAAKVRQTARPPIYFQHRGHSMTIVGLEKRKNGSRELLVFDPLFRVSPGITRYIGRRYPQHKGASAQHHAAMSIFRRGHRYLKKYHEFEILRLSQ